MLLFAVLGFTCSCSQTTSANTDDDLNFGVNYSSSSNKSSSSKDDDTKKSSSSSQDSKIESSSSVYAESGAPWEGETAKNFEEGMGTKSAPYLIATAEQLAYLSYLTNLDNSKTKSVYYKLVSDIYLNQGELLNAKGEFVGDTSKLFKWTPIGTSSSFLGYFDGDGHTIEGLFISTTNNSYGLFGYNGGKISNLTIKNSYIKAKDNTAAFAGVNYGEIDNVVNEATVTGNNAVGGIAGGTQSLGKYNGKTIFESSSISMVKNNGIISGTSNVGGICGRGDSGIIEKSENRGIINGTKDYTGGIVGFNAHQATALRDLLNNGNVNGVNYVSGISGGGTTTVFGLYSYARSISNSTNEGEISGTKYVAGIVAYAYGLVGENLSNSGKIEGDTHVAGIFGYAEKDTLENIYNLGEISGKSNVGGITGNTKTSVYAYMYNAGNISCEKFCGSTFAEVSNTTINSVYYLEDSFAEGFASNDGGGTVTPKTETQMKSEGFAETLGDGFLYQKDSYPVFAN